MATFAFTDGYVSIGGNVLSSYCKAATLEVSADELEDTAFGDTFRSRIPGLKDWSLKLEFNQDVANGLLDAIVWPLLGTVAALELRPTSSAVGTSNPKWTGNLLVSQWNPLDGSVGDLATVSVTWPGAGTLTRATA